VLTHFLRTYLRPYVPDHIGAAQESNVLPAQAKGRGGEHEAELRPPPATAGWLPSSLLQGTSGRWLGQYRRRALRETAFTEHDGERPVTRRVAGPEVRRS